MKTDPKITMKTKYRRLNQELEPSQYMYMIEAHPSLQKKCPGHLTETKFYKSDVICVYTLERTQI